MKELVNLIPDDKINLQWWLLLKKKNTVVNKEMQICKDKGHDPPKYLPIFLTLNLL